MGSSKFQQSRSFRIKIEGKLKMSKEEEIKIFAADYDCDGITLILAENGRYCLSFNPNRENPYAIEWIDSVSLWSTKL